MHPPARLRTLSRFTFYVSRFRLTPACFCPIVRLMSVASLSNVEKDFGERLLFDKISLTIYEGERIGLIGDNGSGKTTLFKILTGEMAADGGNVAVGKGLRVGYLTQDP